MGQKWAFLLVLALFSVLTLSVTLPATTSADTSDEEAIRARAMQFPDAWNKHDAKAMVELWADDGDFVDPFGQAAQGKDAVEKLFAESFETYMKETTYSLSLKWIDMVRPDVAISTWDGMVGGMKNPGGEALPDLHHIVTVVTEKDENGKWWVVSTRAQVPASMGPRNSPAKDE